MIENENDDPKPQNQENPVDFFSDWEYDIIPKPKTDPLDFFSDWEL